MSHFVSVRQGKQNLHWTIILIMHDKLLYFSSGCTVIFYYLTFITQNILAYFSYILIILFTYNCFLKLTSLRQPSIKLITTHSNSESHKKKMNCTALWPHYTASSEGTELSWVVSSWPCEKPVVKQESKLNSTEATKRSPMDTADDGSQVFPLCTYYSTSP